MSGTEARERLELYIHIPFCVKKCFYCDFLSFPSETAVRERYVGQLVQEIAAMGGRYPSFEVTSVFLGGGTPSILLAEQTERILQAVRESFCLCGDAEITTEANPGTLDAEKLTRYREAGINRLSLGLQSADDGELERLGRIHTYGDFLTSFELARKSGFTNINIDLMSALPGQTLESYRRTLELAVSLRPEHLSAYSLIIEEGTPFYDWYERDRLSLPDEDVEREMYHFTKAFLQEQGYDRYEISNYAKKGYECRHNIGYWDGTSYLGLGLGASSYLEGERFFNKKEIERYLGYQRTDFLKRSHHQEIQKLTAEERMEEFMFLGLRMRKGVSAGEFEKRFGVPIREIYGPVLERFEREGLLETDGESGSVRLTDYGIDVSNRVLCEFLLPR